MLLRTLILSEWEVQLLPFVWVLLIQFASYSQLSMHQQAIDDKVVLGIGLILAGADAHPCSSWVCKGSKLGNNPPTTVSWTRMELPRAYNYGHCFQISAESSAGMDAGIILLDDIPKLFYQSGLLAVLYSTKGFLQRSIVTPGGLPLASCCWWR